MIERVNINDIGGEVVKEDDRYVVKDNRLLNNLIVSSTNLKPNKSTSGHSHEGQEEVYYFISGNGTMVLDDKEFIVVPGDVVLIPDGAYHRVHAAEHGCYFVCVFDGARKH